MHRCPSCDDFVTMVTCGQCGNGDNGTIAALFDANISLPKLVCGNDRNKPLDYLDVHHHHEHHEHHLHLDEGLWEEDSKPASCTRSKP